MDSRDSGPYIPGYTSLEAEALIAKRASVYFDELTGVNHPEIIVDDLVLRVRAGELTDMDAANVVRYLDFNNFVGELVTRMHHERS